MESSPIAWCKPAPREVRFAETPIAAGSISRRKTNPVDVDVAASVVLYHMEDPIRLLELIAARTDAFHLWTHDMSGDTMPNGDPRRGAAIAAAESQDWRGVPIRLYKRSYYGAWRSKSFCGGMYDLHRWVEKNDIVRVINALGFDDVRLAHDEPNHDNGPSFSVFARRTKG
jgi:hypothetical protein